MVENHYIIWTNLSMSISRGLTKVNIVPHSGARDKEEVWASRERNWPKTLESEQGSFCGGGHPGERCVQGVKKGDASRSGPGQQGLCCRLVP